MPAGPVITESLSTVVVEEEKEEESKGKKKEKGEDKGWEK